VLGSVSQQQTALSVPPCFTAALSTRRLHVQRIVTPSPGAAVARGRRCLRVTFASRKVSNGRALPKLHASCAAAESFLRFFPWFVTSILCTHGVAVAASFASYTQSARMRCDTNGGMVLVNGSYRWKAGATRVLCVSSHFPCLIRMCRHEYLHQWSRRR